MLKVLNGKLLALFVTLCAGLACSSLNSQETAGDAEKGPVNLPSGVVNQWEFAESWNESAVILILTSENELYLEQVTLVSDPQFELKEVRLEKISITKEQLLEKLKGISENTDPEKHIVYLKVDAGTRFDNVQAVLRILRGAGISTVGLITEKKTEWDAGLKGLFRVELQPVPVPVGPDVLVRLSPLFLVAVLDESGNVSINREDFGPISDTLKLENLLSRVIKDRTDQGVFRAGSNEIERTVNLRASGSSRYGDFVKLVDALKGSGAEPIVIALDEPEPLPTLELKAIDSPDNTNSQE